MIKRYYLLCLLVLTSISVSAQVFTTWWQQSGPYCEQSLALCADKAGNVYQLLNYQQGTTVGGTTLPQNNLCRSEVALIKYNSAGNVLWTVTIEAIKKTSNDTLLEEMYIYDTIGAFSNPCYIQPNVGVDGLGYIYFSTQIRGTPGDSMYVRGTNQTRVGAVLTDDFMLLLIKVDTTGHVTKGDILNKGLGSPLNVNLPVSYYYRPSLRSFVLNKEGEYVVVEETDSVYNSPSSSQQNLTKIFSLTKYDEQHNPTLLKDGFNQVGIAESWDRYMGLNSDQSSNLYFSTLLLTQNDDSIRLQHPRFLYGGTRNFGIIKMNAQGRQWFSAITASPTYLMYSEPCVFTTTPQSGRSYVSKKFNQFSIWQLLADGSEQTHFSAGQEDILLIGVDSNGYETWTKKWGSTGNEGVMAIASDSLDNVYVCGYTTSPVLTIDSFTLRSSGTPVFFLAILDSSGQAKKILQLNGNFFTYNQGVNLGLVVTAPGKGFIHGKFTGTVSGFCPPPASVGKDDAFILGFGWLDTLQLTGCYAVVSPSGKVYAQDGLYYDTTTTSNGCRHVLVVKVTLNKSYNEINITACERYYLPGVKRWYNQSGHYYDTLTNTFGCDSIVRIHLLIHPLQQQNITVPFCRSYTSPGGQHITQSGYYTDTLKNQYGCDSLLFIHAIATYTKATITINQCSPFTLPGSGITISESGVYLDTLMNQLGCDSILTVVYQPLPVVSEVDIEACSSQYSPSRHQLMSRTGLYTDTLRQEGGCDSVLMINFTIAPINLLTTVSNRITCDTPEAQLEAIAERSDIRWYPTDGLAHPNERITNVRATVSGWYYAEVTHELGCKAIDSVWVEVARQSNATNSSDNVFTPNGDGLNDCFGSAGERNELIGLVVYDRWGTEVYSGTFCWNGSDKQGNDLPGGTYGYIRTIKNNCGEEQCLRGMVLLLR